jgi:hypothetical protein
VTRQAPIQNCAPADAVCCDSDHNGFWCAKDPNNPNNIPFCCPNGNGFCCPSDLQCCPDEKGGRCCIDVADCCAINEDCDTGEVCDLGCCVPE